MTAVAGRSSRKAPRSCGRRRSASSTRWTTSRSMASSSWSPSISPTAVRRRPSCSRSWSASRSPRHRRGSRRVARAQRSSCSCRRCGRRRSARATTERPVPVDAAQECGAAAPGGPRRARPDPSAIGGSPSSATINQVWARSIRRSPTPPRVQSISTGPSAVSITLSGCRSQCTTPGALDLAPLWHPLGAPARRRGGGAGRRATGRPTRSRHGWVSRPSSAARPSIRSITRSAPSASNDLGHAHPVLADPRHHPRLDRRCPSAGGSGAAPVRRRRHTPASRAPPRSAAPTHHRFGRDGHRRAAGRDRADLRRA